MFNTTNQYQQRFEPAPALQVEPVVPSMTEAFCALVQGLRDLNNRLAEIRLRLFGESESQPPQAVTNAPVASVQTSLAYVREEIQQASDQVSSILNRL